MFMCIVFVLYTYTHTWGCMCVFDKFGNLCRACNASQDAALFIDLIPRKLNSNLIMFSASLDYAINHWNE